MSSRLYTIVIDAADPAALARFWAQVLDFRILFEDATQVVVARDDDTYPGIIFVPVPEATMVKNRVHIDLNPEDQEAEVARLVALGARDRKSDIGQGPDVTWTVLADPEGNEFCVLRPRPGGV
ncbi:MAG: VOC family protein [Candidatus Dormibacteria bacterium]